MIKTKTRWILVLHSLIKRQRLSLTLKTLMASHLRPLKSIEISETNLTLTNSLILNSFFKTILNTIIILIFSFISLLIFSRKRWLKPFLNYKITSKWKRVKSSSNKVLKEECSLVNSLVTNASSKRDSLRSIECQLLMKSWRNHACCKK